LEFPNRVYTRDEVQKARELIKDGYKHLLEVTGNPEFKRKVEESLQLIKTANYYDFLRTYIKQIIEIKGLTQLREAEASVWVNMYAVEDSVHGASLFVHKAQQMKDYVEGRLYFDKGEIKAVKKRIEFLNALREKSESKIIKKKCIELLKRWTEITYP